MSDRLRVRRHPERAVYDRGAIYSILDEALFCHVGFVTDDQPFVIPTVHARVDDLVYLHGSPASRMLRSLADGVDVCVTVTIVDGIVLARSVYNHSLNYRSALVLGRARPVDDPQEKRTALAAIVDHIVHGRGADARAPSESELAATSVLALSLDEASAKVRSGPPKDFDADLARSTWSGVLPLRVVASEPEPDAHVPEGVPIPSYVAEYRRPAQPDG